MMPPTATVKKRRSRKKKPVDSDPEAERQEQELRMKIKQSLHTQQVLRTEVEEEDKAQQRTLNVHNVVDNDVRRGMMPNMGNNPLAMNNMLLSQMAMGYGGIQPQMGGMGMPQSPQEQYQYNSQIHQYGYQDRGASPGMGGPANISSMQQQMQQMKLQLELQQKQLEQQLLLKQHLQLQQQRSAYAQNGGGSQTNSGSQTPDLGGSGHTPVPQSSDGSSPSPQYLPQTHFQQGSGHRSGTQPSPPPTQSQNQGATKGQALLYNLQEQAAQQPQYQSQSYASPQLSSATPPNQQANGQYDQPLGRLDTQDTRKLSNTGLKSSQETNDKSLFSLSSNAESWLKAGSMNSSSLNNSMAFHSVGNMSASFGSEMGGLDASRSSLEKSNVPNNVVLEGGAVGGAAPRGSGGDGADAKKYADDRISKGPAYTETTVGLHPIQENEATDSPDNAGKFAQSSIMMSLVDGEWAQSHLTEAGPAGSLNYNELGMSLDSTAFNSLMQQSQGGDLNLSTLIASETATKLEEEAMAMQKQSSSSSEGNNPGTGSPASATKIEGGKPSDSGANGNGQGRPKLVRLRTKETSAGSSELSSEPGEEHRLSKESKESSYSKGCVGNRRGSNFSKMSMMSEISQWTKNNPFDASSMMSMGGETPAGGDGGATKKKPQQHTQKQNALYDMNMRDSNCPVDMGDFHSVGGSVANSLDISMMSSMTGEGLNVGEGGLNESLRNLDISAKSSGDRSGSA